jgi:hypothetical protein
MQKYSNYNTIRVSIFNVCRSIYQDIFYTILIISTFIYLTTYLSTTISMIYRKIEKQKKYVRGGIFYQRFNSW